MMIAISRISIHFFLYIYVMDVFRKYSYEIIKSIFDYIVSVLCLILLIPLIVILSFIIRLTTKGPVIYSQIRIGRDGKPFSMYKFRSMYFGAKNGAPLLSGRNDKRITPVGRFMRKHRLDEIPNFINVLKGEMSIVGPRPEQEYYINQIVILAPEYKILLEVKPGITSWGIVKYGYASNIEKMAERLNYDLCYMKNRSFWFDLKVILFTAGIILKGEGV
jgi:lipopolysaccharide/colanic/teichoic acid biosynthesis glycosyltransferase